MQNSSQPPRLEDHSSWESLTDDELGGFALANILEYGRSGDGDLVSHLMALYGHLVATTPNEDRIRHDRRSRLACISSKKIADVLSNYSGKPTK